MLSNGKELLGELYGRDHLTYKEIEDLGLTVVTENGETVSAEQLRSKIFRIVDCDERSGYVVRNMETTGKARPSATFKRPLRRRSRLLGREADRYYSDLGRFSRMARGGLFPRWRSPRFSRKTFARSFTISGSGPASSPTPILGSENVRPRQSPYDSRAYCNGTG